MPTRWPSTSLFATSTTKGLRMRREVMPAGGHTG
jgi:hypothetical protein